MATSARSGTGATTDPFGGFFGGLGGLDGFGHTAATPFDLAPIPGSPETVLTVSGLPPLDQQVEGYQTFDFTPAGGTDSIGTVNADVSTLTAPIGFTNTEYLVTSSDGFIRQAADLVGPVSSSLPGDGSTFDIASFGPFENIYSSVVPVAQERFTDLATIAPAGHDIVSDTFVTPFGSFDLTPLIGDFNASSGLTHDLFVSLIDPSGITGFTGVDSLLGVLDPFSFL